MLNTKTIQLIPLRSPISNGALKANELPSRLKLLSWGENPSVKGAVRVSELSADVVPQNQSARGFAEIALDFEHNTVPGSPEYERSQEPRRVAAYGTPRVVKGEGLYLENLRWTPAGQSEALNFVDLSPAVEMDAQGNILFVHSAALTRNGAVEGLSFFNVEIKTPKTMPEKFIALTALCAALGLPETSDEAAVTAKLKEAITPSKELTALSALVKDGKVIVLDTVSDLDSRLKKIEEAGTKQIATLSATIDGKVVNFTAEDVVKLSARFDALENKLTAASTALEAKERTDLIARFSAEGKVPKGEDGKELSNEQLETFNVSSLKLLLANTPATVPLNARGGKAKEGKNFGELKGIAKAIAAHAAGE